MPEPQPTVAPPRSRRSFLVLSLRVLMVLIAALAVWFANVTNRARRQAEVLAALRVARCNVEFDYDYLETYRGGPPTPVMGGQPPGPVWLRRMVGDEYFRKVVSVQRFSQWPVPSPRKLERSYAGPRPEDDLLSKLASLGGLRNLDIAWNEVSDRGMASARKLYVLETLGISSCPNITDAGLVALEGLPRLKRVTIRECAITDRSFAHLAKLPALEQLRVTGCALGDAGMVHLKGMHSLKFLELESPELTDAGLAHLSDLPRLLQLEIQGASITGKGLANLSKAPLLLSLGLRDCPITDEGLAALPRLKELANLTITPSGPPLTDASLAALHRHTGLTSLYLGRADRKRTSFTDRGLVALVRALPQLTTLYLEAPYLDLDAIKQLTEERPSLKVISLQ